MPLNRDGQSSRVLALSPCNIPPGK
jgi:hypothetical protein